MADKKDIFKEAYERYEYARRAEENNRKLAEEDIKFAHDEDGQWDEKAKSLREGLPCYTYNKTAAVVDQIVSDYRQNRISIDVKSADNNGTEELAKIYRGLIRNIENNSKAKNAYENALLYATSGGFGFWRVITDYKSDDSFDQEILIKQVANPFSVYIDPNAVEADRSDMNWAIIEENMPIDEFKKLYGDSVPKEWQPDYKNYSKWINENTVTVAEYWKKKAIKKTICLLSNGTVVDKDEDLLSVLDELAANGITIEREREVESHKITVTKLGGGEVLEEEREWPGKYIPVVPVYGKSIIIKGEFKCRGAIRFAKDAQRSYNYHRSAAVETLALRPKAPYLATKDMINGHEAMWKHANIKNYPYLLYNPDPKGGRPQREPAPDLPAALFTAAGVDADDIKATTGVYDASLGARSNETSGKAILARERQGDIANYEFIDNLITAIEHTGRILVDLIPRIYDSERIERIIGEDGKEQTVTINQQIVDYQTGNTVILNDLSQGKYAVVADTGANYQTARIEAATKLLELGRTSEAVAPLIMDLVIENLDMRGSDKLLKRLRKQMLMSGIIEPETEEEAQMMQTMRQPPPDPEKEAGVQKDLAQAEKYQADAEQTRIETQAVVTGYSPPPRV